MDLELLQACYENDLGRVKELLDHGVDPNLQDFRGWTALHWASCQGHTDVVLLLLDHGADQNLRDKQGQTVLIKASCYGHIEVIRLLLLDRRTDPNLQDVDGWTPLHWASRFGNTDVVKLIWGWTIVKPLTDLGIFPEGLIREHLTLDL
jgi:ankyrin repeat protein